MQGLFRFSLSSATVAALTLAFGISNQASAHSSSTSGSSSSSGGYSHVSGSSSSSGSSSTGGSSGSSGGHHKIKLKLTKPRFEQLSWFEQHLRLEQLIGRFHWRFEQRWARAATTRPPVAPALMATTQVAYLNVKVPADAKVYLQDQLMTLSGDPVPLRHSRDRDGHAGRLSREG